MGNLIGLETGAENVWNEVVSGGSPTARVYLMQKCFAGDAKSDKPNHSFLKVQFTT